MRKLKGRLFGRSGKKGYTLAEMLSVVAIIAVIAAIAIPSIILINRAIKFKQRNEYAKTVFLAAQSHLTDMRATGGLPVLEAASGEELYVVKEEDNPTSGFPTEDWNGQYKYTSSNIIGGEEAVGPFDIVLPSGTVDEAVRNKQILIEYNPKNGNVYAVFYSEEGTSLTYDNVIRDPKDDGTDAAAKSIKASQKERKKIMLGYYCGSAMTSSEEFEVETCKAELSFTNGEEAIVTVKIPLPSQYNASRADFAEGLSVTLEIQREAIANTTGAAQQRAPGAAPNALDEDEPDADRPIEVELVVDLNENARWSDDGRYLLIDYVLDSLVSGKSFANVSASVGGSTINIENEDSFCVLPGENVTIIANAEFNNDTGAAVIIESGMISDVNPMFASVAEDPTGKTGQYILSVANGRNLQNINALSPSVAEKISIVNIEDDINWNNTVTYYNKKYAFSGKTYKNATDADPDTKLDPTRQLPYFVPIHNDTLFGEASFVTPSADNTQGLLGLARRLLERFTELFGVNITGNKLTPTLTDELDGTVVNGVLTVEHTVIEGNGHKIYFINIDTTKYPVSAQFYQNKQDKAVVDLINNDRFTGVFGYLNTELNGLYIVNPIVKGYKLTNEQGFGKNNPATGALVGATGYDALITDCGVYIDNTVDGYSLNAHKNPAELYDPNADQTWYGVSGSGAVGGLVGYAKSHKTLTYSYELDDDHLAFSRCFAAVNVRGQMRGNDSSMDFGYTNGVGGLVGNAELSNFYQCYASGNVIGDGCRVGNGSLATRLSQGSEIFDISYDARKSFGVGGFVGTSHGVRYTDCFATGNIYGICPQAYLQDEDAVTGSVGGFVGVMGYDETKSYGNDAGVVEVAQRTVFTNCYAVGLARISGKDNYIESFAGLTARVTDQYFSSEALEPNETNGLYWRGNYYEALAPYWFKKGVKTTTPPYESYIFKDTYYLSNYEDGTYEGTEQQKQSNKCAWAIDYETLTNLPGNHASKTWRDAKIAEIKQWPGHFDIGQINIAELISNVGNLNFNYGDIYFGDWFLQTEKEYQDYIKNNNGKEPGILRREYWNNLYSEALRGIYGTKLEDFPRLAEIYQTRLSEGFNDGNWVAATSATTHSYSLAPGVVYPFSILSGMDYYGDWPGRTLTAGLAYYEQYSDGSFGYYLDRDNTSTLRNDKTIVSDGYAVLTANRNDKPTVTVNGKGYELLVSSNSFSTGSRIYFAHYLPYEALQVDGDEYYTPIKIGFGGVEYNMYFNPDVALSQVNPTIGNNSAKPDGLPGQIYIRTARQLAAIAGESKYCGEDYSFVQMLDIDAGTYTASSYASGLVSDSYTHTPTITVKAIGTELTPFNGSYNGSRGYVEDGATLTNYDPAAGLFAYIGASGRVSDLRYTGTGVSAPEQDSAAVFADVSEGSISNITLTVSGNCSISAKTDAGVLVGRNAGSITGCTVTAETVNVSGVHGGIVGESTGGSISGLKVTMTELKANCTGSVGTIVGKAVDTELSSSDDDALAVRISGKAAEMGGIAGRLENGKLSGFTVTFAGANGGNSADIFGGAVGAAENANIINLSVIAGKGSSFTGSYAAGVIGKAEGTSIRNSTLTLNGQINGGEQAAGLACSLGGDGTVELCTVDLSSGVIKGKYAAGIAVTASGRISESKTAMYKAAKIDGSEQAAGFVCTASEGAQINRCYVNGYVNAKETVTKDFNLYISSSRMAAGFALVNNGRIIDSTVSPANHSKTGYEAQEYRAVTINYLHVKAPSAAGFALENNGTLSGCNALGTIEGGNADNAAGFAIRNTGSVDRCFANTTVNGYAFIAGNDGKAQNSYAWYYGTGSQPDAVDPANENAGTYYGCYFAPLAINTQTGMPIADDNSEFTVFPGEGYAIETNGETAPADGKTAVKVYSAAMSTELGTKILNGEKGSTWLDGIYYTATYPFSKIVPAVYPYPLMHYHFGDWTPGTVDHYGVVYYELVNGSYYMHLVDSVNTDLTRDHISYSFDNLQNGEIKSAGYLVYVSNTAQIASVFGQNGEEIGFTLTPADDFEANAIFTGSPMASDTFKEKYDFYTLNTDSRPAGFIGLDESKTYINGLYARAIAKEPFPEGSEWEIRTGNQFANISYYKNGSFKQTNDLTVTGALADFGGSYNGSGCTIDPNGKAAIFGELSGKLHDVNVAGTANVSLSGTQGVLASGLNAGSELTNVALDANAVCTASGSYGLVAGELAGGSFNNVSVKGSITGSGTIGGFVGTVTAGELDAAGITLECALNIDAASTGSVVGGLVGEDKGAVIRNLRVEKLGEDGTEDKETKLVTIKLTKQGGGNVTVGGIVGCMTAGELKDCTLKNTSIEIAGRSVGSHKVGGAVGTDRTEPNQSLETRVKYTNVETTAVIAGDWAGIGGVTVSNPTGFGSVGKFIGFINDGQFANCSGLGENAKGFGFYGTLAQTVTPVGDNIYDSSVYVEQSPMQLTLLDNSETQHYALTMADGSVVDLNKSSGQYADGNIYSFKAEFTDCVYEKNDVRLLLTPAYSFYYSKDKEDAHTKYTTERINSTSQFTVGDYYLFANRDSTKVAYPIANDSDGKLGRNDFLSEFEAGTPQENSLWCYNGGSYWATFIGNKYLCVDGRLQYKNGKLISGVHAFSESEVGNIVQFTMDTISGDYFRFYSHGSLLYANHYSYLDVDKSDCAGEGTGTGSLKGFAIYHVNRTPYWILEFNYNNMGMVIAETPLD